MDKKAKLIACPCCGYKTILGDFEGCHVCGWEHDPFQVRYPDDIGANGNLTLRQAQRNFQNTGNARAKSSGYKTEPDEERDPIWKSLPPLSECPDGPIVCPLRSEWLSCPCCGYRMITEELDRCSMCYWIHDLSQENNPDSRSGSNVVSLREAQQNFLKFGKCAKEYKDLGQTPRKNDERDPNWNPLPPLAENA